MGITHKLFSTRGGALVLSAFAAALAGTMILVYVAKYRDSVKADAAPVTVLVAGKAIPKGTSGAVIAANGLYTVTTTRQSKLLEGALSDPSSLRGTVATRDIYPGAQLTSADFAAASTNLAATLTAAQRVVSVPLDAAHGLAGQLQVGDRVDVYAAFNVVTLGPNGVPVSGGQSRPVLRLIVPNAPVVAIAGKSGGLAASGGTSNVGLKVTSQQAANIAFASDNGKVWLTLRPSAGASASSTNIVTAETLLLGVPAITVLHSFGGAR